MNNLIDWGKGIINNIGWGQNYDVNGFGKIYDTSNFAETIFKKTITTFSILADSLKYTVDSIIININKLFE